MNLFSLFRKQEKAIQPGLYHYIAPQGDPRNYRLHLRVEPGGRGVLIVNASTVLHLNETATEYAYYFIQNTPAEAAAQAVSARYQVDRSVARLDYLDLADRILTLIETPDLDPVTYLDFDRKSPYTTNLSAPFRLDCAITYDLPEGANPEEAPVKRVERELSTEEWKSVLSKAWQAGIPHVIFTGGEPTLRQDLLTLISQAESLGQVSGLLTDGLRFVDKSYLEELLQTGLDHLMIVLHPDLDDSWTAIKNALAADVFTAVHLTVTGDNLAKVPEHLQRLARLGVPAISLSAAGSEHQTALPGLRSAADNLQLSLVWDLPVPYSALNPIRLEVKDDQVVEGAGRAWLYVEPDGDVLPAQGINRVMGNFLRDPWEKIWAARRSPS